MSVFLLSHKEKFIIAVVIATTFISMTISIGSNTIAAIVAVVGTVTPAEAQSFTLGDNNLRNDQSSNLNPNQQGSSSDADLKFAYTKLGVLGGIYQLISYDSTTDTLTLRSTAAAMPQESNTQSNFQNFQNSQSRQLSESEKNNLKQLVDDNGFFEANSFYPPSTKGAQNYTSLYVLSITMDNRLHTVLWTDASNNVPAGLLSVAQAIERHQANDNQSNNQRNMNAGGNDSFNFQNDQRNMNGGINDIFNYQGN
jgi:hypothetical protein